MTSVSDTEGRSVKALRRTSRVSATPFRFDPLDYAMVALDEPLSYKQAMTSVDRDGWMKAIQDEFDAHEKNKTWTTVKTTSDMNVIGSKWVFKVKRDADGNAVKLKARLVAKGYNQEYGVDFKETFAPVLKAKSLRMIFALPSSPTTRIEQLDVKSAFLNASVKEDIYISIPEGMDAPPGHVLKLRQALYGIKQAPNEWRKEIHSFILSLGYVAKTEILQQDACWRASKRSVRERVPNYQGLLVTRCRMLTNTRATLSVLEHEACWKATRGWALNSRAKYGRQTTSNEHELWNPIDALHPGTDTSLPDVLFSSAVLCHIPSQLHACFSRMYVLFRSFFLI